MSDRYVPLSVRRAGPRGRFGWKVKSMRETLALRLAPWLTPTHTGPITDSSSDGSIRFKNCWIETPPERQP